MSQRAQFESKLMVSIWHCGELKMNMNNQIISWTATSAIYFLAHLLALSFWNFSLLSVIFLGKKNESKIGEKYQANRIYIQFTAVMNLLLRFFFILINALNITMIMIEMIVHYYMHAWRVSLFVCRWVWVCVETNAHMRVIKIVYFHVLTK